MAGPLHEMLDVDQYKLDVALETAKSGDPALILHTSDEPDDAEDPEWAAICEAVASGDAVRFRCVGTDMAVRFDCFMEVEVIDETDTFMLTALDRRGHRPLDPQLPLDDHRSLLAALADRYPLVSLSDARTRGRGWTIGGIIEVGDRDVTIKGVNTLGEWTGEHTHPYKRVEAISFGTAYNESLNLVLA